jgi:biotin-[acetyl-CoA-carboxylase] ligase BirA-like protein
MTPFKKLTLKSVAKIYQPFLSLFKDKVFSVYHTTQKFLFENNLNHETFDSIASTNDIAKDEAFLISSDLKVYLADAQTKGRGRNTNTWQNSPKGSSLLVSFSVLCKSAPQAITAPLFGLAVYECLQNNFPSEHWSLKAPNDIYFKDKKIAGLLIETVQKGIDHRLIIGLGMNIFSAPNEIKTSSYLAKGVPLNKKSWLAFFHELITAMQKTSTTCLAPNLTLNERERLLKALNTNPLLNSPFKMVSPFGDLVSEDSTISWREL